VIDNRGHPAVRRDFQKVGSQLIATTNIDRLDLIRDGGFLEQDGNFFPVWSGPEIEIDHLIYPPCGWLVASNLLLESASGVQGLASESGGLCFKSFSGCCVHARLNGWVRASSARLPSHLLSS